MHPKILYAAHVSQVLDGKTGIDCVDGQDNNFVQVDQFARAIIQYCATVADDAASHNLDPSKFGRLIKEEFGIL